MKCENLSLCIINKDDASNLKRLIRRAKKFVGEIIVVDMGSKDSSVVAAIHAGATKVIKRPDFLDDDGVLKSFALARNESFKHATKDWKMWLDTDDDLSDWESLKGFVTHLQSIRKKCEKCEKCVGYMFYDYSWSEDRKKCFQVLYRERIFHKDDNPTWTNPTNEHVIYHLETKEILSENIRVINLSNAFRGQLYDTNFKIKSGKLKNPIIVMFVIC